MSNQTEAFSVALWGSDSVSSLRVSKTVDRGTAFLLVDSILKADGTLRSAEDLDGIPSAQDLAALRLAYQRFHTLLFLMGSVRDSSQRSIEIWQDDSAPDPSEVVHLSAGDKTRAAWVGANLGECLDQAYKDNKDEIEAR